MKMTQSISGLLNPRFRLKLAINDAFDIETAKPQAQAASDFQEQNVDDSQAQAVGGDSGAEPVETAQESTTSPSFQSSETPSTTEVVSTTVPQPRTERPSVETIRVPATPEALQFSKATGKYEFFSEEARQRRELEQAASTLSKVNFVNFYSVDNAFKFWQINHIPRQGPEFEKFITDKLYYAWEAYEPFKRSIMVENPAIRNNRSLIQRVYNNYLYNVGPKWWIFQPHYIEGSYYLWGLRSSFSKALSPFVDLNSAINSLYRQIDAASQYTRRQTAYALAIWELGRPEEAEVRKVLTDIASDLHTIQESVKHFVKNGISDTSEIKPDNMVYMPLLDANKIRQVLNAHRTAIALYRNRIPQNVLNAISEDLQTTENMAYLFIDENYGRSTKDTYAYPLFLSRLPYVIRRAAVIDFFPETRAKVLNNEPFNTSPTTTYAGFERLQQYIVQTSDKGIVPDYSKFHANLMAVNFLRALQLTPDIKEYARREELRAFSNNLPTIF